MSFPSPDAHARMGLRMSTLQLSISFLTCLATAFSWRYFRFFVHIYAYLRLNINSHKPLAPGDPKTCTIIISTVSDHDNEELQECITTCLNNEPKAIILSTDNPHRAKGLENLARHMRTSSVQIFVEQSGVASKRRQMMQAANRVTTPLIAFIDDHIFLPESFLPSSISEFEDPQVGICGTFKKVRRKALLSKSIIGKYWERFWNFIGMIYLERHNYETGCTHELDRGVFVVSSRAMLIRSSIVQDRMFQDAFLNEYIFGIAGPIDVGDDNFITRWILTLYWNIAISKVPVETTLGEFVKLPWQLLRWRRTTYQNLDILFCWQLWLFWPWTAWTAYVPALFNFAIIWDLGMIYCLTNTRFYADYTHPRLLVIWFCVFIYISKVVKLLPHFRRYPSDFFLFFFPIPAYPIFGWLHIGWSISAICTVLRYDWSGRNFSQTPVI
ncbi:hypothetical protein GGI35DRAFT_471474 [Trichoderma velutinum]